MISCGSEHCSYNALPVVVTSCNSSSQEGEGAADHETSTIRSSPLEEMGAAPLAAARATSTTSVDPAVPLTAVTAFQARKKRSFAGGYSLSGVTETVIGKHVIGGGGGGAGGKTQGCPRDRLQRHRLQVAGTVRIPEAWCGEARLREWMSSCDVEEALHPPGLFMARAALISAGSALSAASPPALLAPPAAPAASLERVHRHLLLVVIWVHGIPLLQMNPLTTISTTMSLLYVGAIVVVAHIGGPRRECMAHEMTFGTFKRAPPLEERHRPMVSLLDDEDYFTLSGAHVPRTRHRQAILQLQLEVSRYPLPPALEAEMGGDHPLPGHLRSLVQMYDQR